MFPYLGVEVQQAPNPEMVRDLIIGNYIARYLIRSKKIDILRVCMKPGVGEEKGVNHWPVCILNLKEVLWGFEWGKFYMGRPLRLEYTGALYHVTSRGVHTIYFRRKRPAVTVVKFKKSGFFRK